MGYGADARDGIDWLQHGWVGRRAIRAMSMYTKPSTEKIAERASITFIAANRPVFCEATPDT
jgi:hypothetical protein